jgi:AcrR family transcriptional regulator
VSPRPRQASDEAILAAVLRAVTAVGPVRMTLADVAREAGLSPAALVQRFGSKRGLLLAFAAQGPDGNRFLFDGLRAAHRSPVAASLGLADGMARMGSTPEQISNTLALLQIDVTDPEFHRFALQSSSQIYEGIRQLVAEAIAAGELRSCPVPRLARALQATMNGSLLNWAICAAGFAAISRPCSRPCGSRGRRAPAAPRRPHGLAARARPTHLDLLLVHRLCVEAQGMWRGPAPAPGLQRISPGSHAYPWAKARGLPG